MIFHALISKPGGASKLQILHYINTNYDTQQVKFGGRTVAYSPYSLPDPGAVGKDCRDDPGGHGGQVPECCL